MRWMGLIVLVLAAAAGCRGDRQAASKEEAPPVAPAHDAAVVPADAAPSRQGTTERIGPDMEPPPPPPGDIMVPELILEE